MSNHNWVTFVNPRNGKVKVVACGHCGINKNIIANTLACKSLSSSQHGMKKLGWEILAISA